jgi:hypothetical protein
LSVSPLISLLAAIAVLLLPSSIERRYSWSISYSARMTALRTGMAQLAHLNQQHSSSAAISSRAAGANGTARLCSSIVELSTYLSLILRAATGSSCSCIWRTAAAAYPTSPHLFVCVCSLCRPKVRFPWVPAQEALQAWTWQDQELPP